VEAEWAEGTGCTLLHSSSPDHLVDLPLLQTKASGVWGLGSVSFLTELMTLAFGSSEEETKAEPGHVVNRGKCASVASQICQLGEGAEPFLTDCPRAPRGPCMG
jgi:hypothetical protein